MGLTLVKNKGGDTGALSSMVVANRSNNVSGGVTRGTEDGGTDDGDGSPERTGRVYLSCPEEIGKEE